MFDVVRLLVEAGASPKSETNYGAAPIWFAAQEGHNDVLQYLITKEHDTYNLMDDKRVSIQIGGFFFRLRQNLSVDYANVEKRRMNHWTTILGFFLRNSYI